jgi:predicted small lipoprotein YifL
MQTVKTTFIVLACVFLLSACGNKGPLYLPGESTGTETASGQEPASEDEEAGVDKNGKKDTKKGLGA